MSSTIKIKRPDMPVPAQASVTSDSVGRYYNIKSYTLAQMVERDAQRQEMVGAILKELKDAATSLETIGRLAGVAEYVGDDGERIPTYMGRGDQIRGYAASRAAVARSALSAITEE